MARASTTSIEPQQQPPPAADFASPAPSSAVSREEIARRAYELYLAHGSLDGFDKEDWIEAERMLNEEAALTKGRA
jgi:hypothetical protein